MTSLLLAQLARVVTGLVLITAGLAGMSHRAAPSLQKAMLQPSELPEGYGKPAYAVYTRYSSQMRVLDPSPYATQLPPQSRPYDYCYPPQSFSDGWKSGLVEAANYGPPGSPSGTGSLLLCMYRFTSTTKAHAEYGVLAHAVKVAIRDGTASTLTLHVLGAESTAYSQSARHEVTYDAIFRRGSTVVDMRYGGTLTFDTTRFSTLVRLVDAHLR